MILCSLWVLSLERSLVPPKYYLSNSFLSILMLNKAKCIQTDMNHDDYI